MDIDLEFLLEQARKGHDVIVQLVNGEPTITIKWGIDRTPTVGTQ